MSEQQTAYYQSLRGSRQIMNLATMSLDPERRRTIIILSAKPSGHPGFDPGKVGRELAGTDALVYWIPRMEDAIRLRTLTDGVVTCYNGAAAVLSPCERNLTILPGDGQYDYLIGKALRRVTFTGDGTVTNPVEADNPAELRALRAENKRLKGEIKRLNNAKTTSMDDDVEAMFGPSADWLDLAIRIAWARLIPAEMKSEQPLPARWRFEPGFADTVRSAPRRGKLVECCARILTGLDERHQLLEGVRGSKGMLGEWGNPVWRSMVMRNSPDAWRIHWTRDDDGNVVFLAAGGHDDLI